MRMVSQPIKNKKPRRYLRGNVTFVEKGCKGNTIFRLQEANVLLLELNITKY